MEIHWPKGARRRPGYKKERERKRYKVGSISLKLYLCPPPTSSDQKALLRLLSWTPLQLSKFSFYTQHKGYIHVLSLQCGFPRACPSPTVKHQHLILFIHIRVFINLYSHKQYFTFFYHFTSLTNSYCFQSV